MYPVTVFLASISARSTQMTNITPHSIAEAAIWNNAEEKSIRSINTLDTKLVPPDSIGFF